MDELKRLADIIRKYASVDVLADSIEAYDGDISDIDELNEMLSDELDYSAW